MILLPLWPIGPDQIKTGEQVERVQPKGAEHVVTGDEFRAEAQGVALFRMELNTWQHMTSCSGLVVERILLDYKI